MGLSNNMAPILKCSLKVEVEGGPACNDELFVCDEVNNVKLTLEDFDAPSENLSNMLWKISDVIDAVRKILDESECGWAEYRVTEKQQDKTITEIRTPCSKIKIVHHKNNKKIELEVTDYCRQIVV